MTVHKKLLIKSKVLNQILWSWCYYNVEEMLYPARWKKITVDQSKVLKNRLFRFWGATRYRNFNKSQEIIKHAFIKEQGTVYSSNWWCMHNAKNIPWTQIGGQVKQDPKMTSYMHVAFHGSLWWWSNFEHFMEVAFCRSNWLGSAFNHTGLKWPVYACRISTTVTCVP